MINHTRHSVAGIFLLIVLSCCQQAVRQGRPDNQLKRFLQNDSVKLEYSILIDTSIPVFSVHSYARNKAQMWTFRYPGLFFLDGKLMEFGEATGSILGSPNAADPKTFEGVHEFKALFSDDMFYSIALKDLTSNNKDSLSSAFEMLFVDFLKKPFFRNDSIFFKTNRPVKNMEVQLRFGVVVKKVSSSQPQQLSAELPVMDSLVGYPLDSFVTDGYKNYFIDVEFKKSYPLLYKGKPKGELTTLFHGANLYFSVP